MHLFHLEIIWEHLIPLHRQTQKNFTSVVTTKLINLQLKKWVFFHNINCIPLGRHRPGSMKPTKKMRQKGDFMGTTDPKQRATRCGKNHIFSRHANFAPCFFRILGWNGLPALCTCHARELLSAGEEWDVLLRSSVGMSGGMVGVQWWEMVVGNCPSSVSYPLPSRHFWVHDFRTFPFWSTSCQHGG